MARSGGVSGCSRAEKTSACVRSGKCRVMPWHSSNPTGNSRGYGAKGKGRAGGRKRLHRAPERSAQAQVHLCRIGVPEKIMQNNMN
ncbi:hypothetical protein NXX23_17680 [Bacteroides ovatus]|nr:hypothetical protein [Bacteroides ovatus]